MMKFVFHEGDTRKGWDCGNLAAERLSMMS